MRTLSHFYRMHYVLSNFEDEQLVHYNIISIKFTLQRHYEIYELAETIVLSDRYKHVYSTYVHVLCTMTYK